MIDAPYVPDLMHLLNACANMCHAAHMAPHLKMAAHVRYMHLLEQFCAKWKLEPTGQTTICLDCGEPGEQMGHQTCPYPGRAGGMS